jgi:hypothetical protein
MFRRSALPLFDRSIGWLPRALQSAALCAAGCVLTIGPAAALDCAAIIMDKRDQFSFGQAPLGAPRSRLPADAAAPRQCDQACEYVDSAGVTYVVKAGEIVSKEIDDASRYHGPLPARITATDSLLTVLMRLGAFTESAPIWSLAPLPDGGLLLRTDACIENGEGARGAYSFTFDRDGRLRKISAELL